MKRTDLDLASRALGGSVRYVSDEFFAACEALLTPTPPVHDTRTFGPHGKIYDGWETRRRRTPGYDWAVVALGVPGVLHEIIVDTSFFLGQLPAGGIGRGHLGGRLAGQGRPWTGPSGSPWCRIRRPAATRRTPTGSTTTRHSPMSG